MKLLAYFLSARSFLRESKINPSMPIFQNCLNLGHSQKVWRNDDRSTDVISPPEEKTRYRFNADAEARLFSAEVEGVFRECVWLALMPMACRGPGGWTHPPTHPGPLCVSGSGHLGGQFGGQFFFASRFVLKTQKNPPGGTHSVRPPPPGWPPTSPIPRSPKWIPPPRQHRGG